MTTPSRLGQQEDGMHPTALAACVMFLGLAEDDVIELRDNADLLPALLAGVGLELRARNVSHGTECLAPFGAISEDYAQALCAAVRCGWGESEFTAGELLDWCETGLSRDRQAALAACRELCRKPGKSDGDLTAVHLGLALKRAAAGSENGPLRLEFAGAMKGVNRWQVRGLRG